MKSYLNKIVALALFAMALTGATFAQSGMREVRANIPFSFYAGRSGAARRRIHNFDQHGRSLGHHRAKSNRKEFLSSRLTGRQLTRRTDRAGL